jgi:hypothetical protein
MQSCGLASLVIPAFLKVKLRFGGYAFFAKIIDAIKD